MTDTHKKIPSHSFILLTIDGQQGINHRNFLNPDVCFHNSIIDFEGKWQGVAQAFYNGIKHDYNQESVAVMVDTVESELV